MVSQAARAAVTRAGAPGRAAPRVYRPRYPQRTALYRLLESRYEEYLWRHPERFERTSGPLRRVVRSAVESYLGCGRLRGGFARIRCPRCHAEHLLAFSCRTRNLCPSCQAKRSTLLGEWVPSVICARASPARCNLGVLRRDREDLVP